MDTLSSLIAALCAGISAGCLLLLSMDLLQKIHLDKNLEEEQSKQLPILIKIFMPLTSNLVPLLRGGMFDAMKISGRNQILMAGYDQLITDEQFLAVKLLSWLTAFVSAVFFLSYGLVPLAFVCGILFLAYPDIWLKSTVKARHLEILKALPNVLDLLTLSVEAGKDFLTAMRDILAKRKLDALGEELKRTLHEIQLGKTRATALKDLVHRVQQPELTSVINAIIQADEMGVSIGQLLRIQGDQLRNKRFARAEKLANEAPVKIIFPVVLFIFPPVIVLLMAPIILQALKTLVR